MADSFSMTRVIEWLLDLEHIQLGKDAPLSLYWQHSIPLWMIAICLVLGVAFVAYLYRQERGSALGRAGLAAFRILGIALVAATICQPVLRLERNRTEPSHVALLIDRSRSMGTSDRYVDSDRANRVARGAGLDDADLLSEHKRFDLLKAALVKDDAAALESLLSHNRLRIYSFGRSVSRDAVIDDPDRLPVAVASLDRLECDADSTNVSAAISAVLRRTEAGRLAAIVLASDGRSTEPTNINEAISEARAQQVPIYTVPIGSPVPRRDVFITAVSVEENVFIKDIAAVRITLGGTGLSESTKVTVRLIDELDNTVLASGTILLSGPFAQEQIELHIQPNRVGRLTCRAEILPLDNEFDRENNVARAAINVLDDTLSVLYVDGYPRYQYRYLKNTLLREPTIRSSCLLLSADPGFVQEGTFPLRRFPSTMEELRNFDVILFGDVDPSGSWLSPAQADLLVEYVVEHGGGFGLIAGPRHSPAKFRGGPLGKLVPVHIDPANGGTYAAPLESSYRAQLTVEGRNSRIFRFDADPARSTRVFDALGNLYWIARTLGPRSGAEVLAEHPVMESPSGPMPLIVAGWVGAGRVIFCGTDDLWRWRRGSGEWMFDAFWLQLIRDLAQGRNVGADRRISIRTPRRQWQYGQRVDVQVDVGDTELLATAGREWQVLIRDAAGSPLTRVPVTRLSDTSHQFEGSFVPLEPGTFTLEIEEVEPRPGRRRASATIEVADVDLETRRPEADHEALRRIAEQTGGSVVELDELAEKLAAIPDRSIRIPDDFSEPLWDSKLVLALFILIILTEWVIRKGYGML